METSIEKLFFEFSQDDSRETYEVSLEFNDYGQTTKSAAISYGRRKSPLEDPSDREKQEETVILYSELHYTNDINSEDYFCEPKVAEASKYRLYAGIPSSGRFSYESLTRDNCAFFTAASVVEIRKSCVRNRGHTIEALIWYLSFLYE
jgi:hypothetical protein